MTLKKFLFGFVLLSGFSVYSYGQQIPYDIQNQINRQNEKRRIQRENDDRMRRSSQINGMQNPKGNSATIYKKATLNKEEKRRRETIVAPDPQDLALLQEFLKQPNTGIFRLFPDADCSTNEVLKADGKCANIYPGTWFYSFREKDYSDGFFFDLQLKNGRLITDGFWSLGILTALGNFSLDKVTLESGGVKFLSDFKFAEKSADIKAQYEQIGDGIKSDGYKYSRDVKAKLGEIYLMRVVAYRVQRKFLQEVSEKGGNDAVNYILLNQDKRADITVAFRVIRAPADGNLTIIWKMLDKKKSPEVIFSE